MVVTISCILHAHCICRNHFPAVLVGTYYISRCIGWNLFSDVLVGTFSRWISWNPFSAVLIGTNVPPFFPPYWLEPIIFPAVLVGTYFLMYWLEPFPAGLVGTHFLPYCLEPMSRRFGWNCFPQNISLCIG